VKELISSNDLLGPIELLYEHSHNWWLSDMSIESLTVSILKHNLKKNQPLCTDLIGIVNKTLNRTMTDQLTDWLTTNNTKYGTSLF
jgi:hypothetical protein